VGRAFAHFASSSNFCGGLGVANGRARLLNLDFGAAEQNFGEESPLKVLPILESECRETRRQAGSLERDLSFTTTKLLSGVRQGSAARREDRGNA
jgi:hypothetical protein